MTKKKIITLIIQTITLTVSVIYLSKILSVEEIKLSLLSVDWKSLWPLIISSILIMFLYTIRFCIMLTPVKVSFKNVWHGIAINNLYNLILPLRSGDIIRAASIENKMSLTKSYGLILLEKLMDLGCFIAISLTFYLFGLKYMLLATVMIVVGFLLYVLISSKLLQINKDKIHTNIILQKLVEFKEGLFTQWTFTALIKIVIITLALRSIEIFSIYIIATACNLDLSLAHYAVIYSIISLAMAIPAAPAFIATYHAMALFILQHFGIMEQEAISYTFISHLFILACGFSFGLTSLPFVNLRFKKQTPSP